MVGRGRGRPAVGPWRGRHEGRARRVPRRRRRDRGDLRRPSRRPALLVRDRGGVRRQRHVVGAPRRLRGRRGARRRADRAPPRARLRASSGRGSPRRAARARDARRRRGAFDRLCRAVAGLRKVESEINEPARDPIFAAARAAVRDDGGRIEGGVWTASTSHEPGRADPLRVRATSSRAEVQARMRAAVEESSPEVEIAFEGFRARAYAHATNRRSSTPCPRRNARRAGRSPSSWRSPRRPTHATSRPVPLHIDRRQPARHRRVGRRRVARADRDCGGARDRRVDGMSRRLDGGPPGVSSTSRHERRCRLCRRREQIWSATNGTAIRAATDVGGTFTDLVYFSTDPRRACRRS